MDRLEEIRQEYADYGESIAERGTGAVPWLITEVDRLRAALAEKDEAIERWRSSRSHHDCMACTVLAEALSTPTPADNTKSIKDRIPKQELGRINIPFTDDADSSEEERG